MDNRGSRMKPTAALRGLAPTLTGVNTRTSVPSQCLQAFLKDLPVPRAVPSKRDPYQRNHLTEQGGERSAFVWASFCSEGRRREDAQEQLHFTWFLSRV